LLADGHAVVVVELDDEALAWTRGGRGAVGVAGDAGDAAVTARAADLAERAGTFSGWVNNAVVFRDASLTGDGPAAVLDAISLNLGLVLTGAATAVSRWRTSGIRGALVNVSSHQAQRAVRGALAYATAKSAVEGLTRALAVDHGPDGIRVNAVALGSITTARYESYLAGLDEAGAARVTAEMAALHPLGRVGQPAEVAAAVAWLLSDEAGFVSGAVLPLDGGRAAQGRDPEEV
jgi:NAD(P)-dependent dehydrogenase (short-subunit alcohol dehydrogenase family)